MDAENRPIRLVSRADALRWSLGDEAEDGTTLGDQTSEAPPATVAPDDTAARAAAIMVSSDQGRLPVVDPDTGALVGLLTRKNLLKVHASAATHEVERQAYFKVGGRKARTTAVVA